MGTPPSSGDRGLADSMSNEEVHEQQAVLSQLKEVPIKSMNASLLMAPLLDHGQYVRGCAIAWLLACWSQCCKPPLTMHAVLRELVHQGSKC